MRSLRLLLLAPLLFLATCTSAETDEARAREQIQQMLEEYLPVLAEAYAKEDPGLLSPWVAEKEVARVRKLLDELAAQGRTFEPTFRSVTVEEVKIWGHANAFVVSHEVWDIKSLAAGTGQVLQQATGQANRVRYQMKRNEGRWRILFRTIAE
jgi:hypothetical protein